MAINIVESAKDIIQRIRTDVQRNLAGSNPFLKNGLLSSISIAFGNRFYDVYRLINYWKNQFFVQTADSDNLAMWSELKDITQTVASPARGPIVMPGDNGTIVDAGFVFVGNNLNYTTDDSAVISTSILSVVKLSQLGGVATAEFASNHLLASGISVTISGANESDYNGTFVISVSEADKITYTVPVATPATAAGTITSTSTTGYANATCTTSGSDTNISSGAIVNPQVQQVGLDSECFVGFGGIAGGTDVQSIEAYRAETISAWQNPTTNFNPEAIKRQCKLISGVTRVFVQRTTPSVGQVTVYFTRDNDDSIIPSSSEVATVKESLNLIVPMNTPFDDVFLFAPTAVPVQFIFSSITPDSNSMRQSIETSLDAFFRTETSVETDLEYEQYITAIKNTFDSVTGEKLQSFSLDGPAGDIQILAGEIPTLAGVSFQ